MSSHHHRFFRAAFVFCALVLPAGSVFAQAQGLSAPPIVFMAPPPSYVVLMPPPVVVFTAPPVVVPPPPVPVQVAPVPPAPSIAARASDEEEHARRFALEGDIELAHASLLGIGGGAGYGGTLRVGPYASRRVALGALVHAGRTLRDDYSIVDAGGYLQGWLSDRVFLETSLLFGSIHLSSNEHLPDLGVGLRFGYDVPVSDSVSVDLSVGMMSHLIVFLESYASVGLSWH